MIIGVSGKIGSGKDTVGRIIQYLTDETVNKVLYPYFEEWDKLDTGNEGSTKFKIVKFADKVKDIVCLLTGCTREQLEDVNFKNTELGEEWTYAKVCSTETFSRPEIYASEKEAFHKARELRLYIAGSDYFAKSFRLTYRRLLQLIGTECGRNIIHPNIWINATMKDYKTIKETFKDSHSEPSGYLIIDTSNKENNIEVKYDRSSFPNWIITDVRFPNEAKAVKDRAGFIIRVNRGEPISNHESETALDDYPFDYVIDNNGTIEELVKEVKYILVKEKVL